ncbi:hypothetical protein ACFQ9X_57220 [Catenulispora yoronensis]
MGRLSDLAGRAKRFLGIGGGTGPAGRRLSPRLRGRRRWPPTGST